MKIAIIGAGFTGLAAGYYLTRDGHQVEIFERDSKPGGLAVGYKDPKWNWTLEYHYHHWFTNDKSVLKLAQEINHKVIIKRPITSSFVDENIYQLDSPTSVLKFPKLNIIDRIRMGTALAMLRYNPVWKPLEHYRAEPYLKKAMGNQAYKTLWEALLVNKLGKYAKEVSLAWFWARVYKRTSSLAYPEGGFLAFAQHLQKVIEKQGGRFYYNTEIAELKSGDKPEDIPRLRVASGGGPPSSARTEQSERVRRTGEERRQDPQFDKVIVTLPSFLFAKIAPELPTSYTDRVKKLKGIGAVNMVLRLKENFFKDNTYWLSMCDIKSPILAIVEHTNFMEKKQYNNEHLVYVGNYMETTDPRFTMPDKKLFELYQPWLKKINPEFEKAIIDYKVFHAPFAQPIVYPNYSKQIPPFYTPLRNVFLANIEQVYPWDRGTNYAVELGHKVSKLVVENRQ